MGFDDLKIFKDYEYDPTMTNGPKTEIEGLDKLIDSGFFAVHERIAFAPMYQKATIGTNSIPSFRHQEYDRVFRIGQALPHNRSRGMIIGLAFNNEHHRGEAWYCQLQTEHGKIVSVDAAAIRGGREELQFRLMNTLALQHRPIVTAVHESAKVIQHLHRGNTFLVGDIHKLREQFEWFADNFREATDWNRGMANAIWAAVCAYYCSEQRPRLGPTAAYPNIGHWAISSFRTSMDISANLSVIEMEVQDERTGERTSVRTVDDRWRGKAEGLF